MGSNKYAHSCPTPLTVGNSRVELQLLPHQRGFYNQGSTPLARLIGIPNFIKSPDDQTGIYGGVASFICQATGDPKPLITWKKEGKKVNSQRFEVKEFDDKSGSVLRIQPLKTNRDEAIYECTASNSVGAIAAPAKLIVLEDDQIPAGFPNIDMGPQLKVVVRTNTATMLCAASGNPDPEIFWFKDMLPVDISSSNGRIKQLWSGALQIENSDESDQGKYECVAVNSAGTRFSSPANLYVRVRRVPPRFSIPPTNCEVMPAGSVNLTCVAVGSPMPLVKWMSDEVELTQEDELPFGRNILQLTNIQQSANYTCVAISTLGRIETTAQVFVKALPKMPTFLQVVETTATSVTLTWKSGNAEPVSYYLVQYRSKTSGNGFQEIDGVASTRYSIGGLSPFSEYEFRVLASNSVGRGPPSRIVEICTGEQAPSSPPLHVRARLLSSTTILVEWESPEEPNGQLQGYRIFYSSEPSNPLSTWQIHNINDSKFTSISGLTPTTTYSLRMLGFTSMGDGPLSDVLQLKTQQGGLRAYNRRITRNPGTSNIKTHTNYRETIGGRLTCVGGTITITSIHQLLPGKPSMMISTMMGNTAMIQWQPPKEMVGEHLGYQLQYKRTDEKTFTVKDFRKTDDHFTFTRLLKGATYIFKLSAKNQAGTGEEYIKEISTPEDMPSSYPQNLRVVGLTSTSTVLVWEQPPLSERNGKIIKYVVVYRDINSKHNSTNSTTETQMTILDLQPDTTYDIRVQAFTNKGGGPFSPSIKSRTTSTSVPVFVKNFDVKAVMKTSVLLSWEVLETYKYQIQLKILYNNQKVEIQGDLKKKLITQLQPDTYYSFVLKSYGNGAGDLQQQVSVRTAPDLLSVKPTRYQPTVDEDRVTIVMPEVPAEAHVRWFYVVVVSETLVSLERWENPEDIDIYEILEADADNSGQTHSQDFLQPFIVAKMAVLPEIFMLADEKKYNGYYNRPLPILQQFRCFVLADLKDLESRTFVASPFSDTFMVNVSEVTSQAQEDPEMLWVVGPVLAVIIIIITVIAILLFKRKHTSSAKDEHILERKDSLMTCITEPVEIRLKCQTLGMRDLPPIPVCDLADHIERQKANDSLLFSQEFQTIDPEQQLTWEHSNLEINRSKNRYANVIAYDHSRVVLTPVNGVPGSNYINANYINGYRKQNAYIATQGPLPETICDFWRMVWEQRSCTIVMMTRLKETSRVKCDQYWPSRGTETYGTIQVTILETLELATYVTRIFSIYKNESCEKREVQQLQFLAWPDHGVPEHPTTALAFLHRTKSCNSPDAGPMVVHCSAGVGRTGCFIAIDAMLERMKYERSVDIYGYVTCMRAQRNYMVQTLDQYMFIHEALLEAATCGKTEVPARGLYTHLQKLTQNVPRENLTAMEQEFKKLTLNGSHKTSTQRCISANLPWNTFKNRLANIMPFESNRVCLQPIRGIEGSDYINASFIDGYRHQKAYIATQGPLAQTTEDLWRMLWEHNSTIVVMLTKLHEMGREKCHQYWPVALSTRYQHFVVDPVAEYNMPEYILREFKVTDARDGQSRTIRQFQYTHWQEQGVPKTVEDFINFIGQVHKTKEQLGQDGPITVHCSAGVGRTGVFITLSIVLERLRYEGVVDIFQTVKILQTQRPAMVQTEEQYHMCYRAALEYLGSFDVYAM
ncbi:receptor-type tyrosine-protein phosphatase F-like [Xiphophorus maculatus]|uniref:receptor-type tyrosine-protein phosphatase F-like n=1 Tax=Xiphophorus maculatus TaxID=8083 RepID=UPI000C6D977D|nr:receptor-type tyrosine-protein phosphatase F-like [Xiphophorus maculatus]